MRKAILATGLSLSMLGALPAPAASAAPAGPDQFKVQVVKAGGSGCPAGSTTVDITDDNRFSVIYDQFFVWTGPGSTPPEHQKFCQVVIDVDVPPGLTYSIVDITHRGSADLVKGAYGSQRASYYWTGEPQTGTAQSKIWGPFSGNWSFNDVLKTVKLDPHPCGSAANLNAKLELGVKATTKEAKKSESSMSHHTTDGKFTTVFQIKWHNC
ncbi:MULTISPECIES: DUF4360 domain-containing protein [Catenuloplanes]|uniref:DUF4360 domain-containing protein n=1 Tax=Catenuloplanes niger TaxID=587534 RepID=A0AAE4CXH2_9ACTN|nr:DUF4360 domain-containing protein [Catenuloplanes niger]MDR7324809.1 hypothetical protein [Catenuloplanes niger]